MVGRFLITTADERSWRTDRPVLFLGEWCKRYERRQIWADLDHETLPYHWDDRRKLLRDYHYVRGIYEERLGWLSQKLNFVHGTAHSERYWRILAGPWLCNFIEILLDRYLAIEAAVTSGKVAGTFVVDTSRKEWVPSDYESFIRWYLGDEYNQFLYSAIIELRGDISFQLLDLPRRDGGPLVYKRSWRRRVADFAARRVPGALNHVVFIASYLSSWQQVELQLSLGQLPYLFSAQIASPIKEPDWELRKSFLAQEGRAGFERVLDLLLPKQIPTAYLEDYSDLRCRAMNSFPQSARVIFTANACWSHEGFKIWAAEKAEQGAKLCIAQHGGHYGMGLWSSAEEHETKICDRYYTWGWDADNLSCECVSISPGALLRAKNRIKPSSSGCILWAAMSLPRYSYWMYSVPVGPQMLAYLNEQKRFYERLAKEVRILLTLRLFPHNFGWDEELRWKDWAPTLRVYRGPVSFLRQLTDSRLFVGTYNSTTFLETCAANYPTVAFWNPDHWEIRPEVVLYVNELRAAGILHDTPESAADKVCEIYQNPASWWLSPKVQRVRSTFCAHFARVNANWLAEWRYEFSRLKNT